MTVIFNVIGVVLATYSLNWGNGRAAFGALYNSTMYLLNPEERAKQIIKVTREGDLGFCRAFWNLSELPPPKLFGPAMDVYRVMRVPMSGALQLATKSGGVQLIPEPSAHGRLLYLSILLMNMSF